jgi:hypothetical protein
MSQLPADSVLLSAGPGSRRSRDSCRIGPPGLPEIRILSVRAGVRFNGLDLSVFAQNALSYNTPTFVSRDLPTTTANGYPYNYDTNDFGRGYAPLTYGATVTYRY